MPIKILMSTDENLVQYIPTLINSISKNNKKVLIYIMTTQVSSKNKEFINMCKPDNIEIKFIDHIPDIQRREDQVVRCPVRALAMFNRIYAPELLSEVDKVIYLDIDTIVNINLNWLYQVKTSEMGLAGVLDLYTPVLKDMLDSNFYSLSNFKYHGDLNVPAFNSGVLVMDFEKMRIHRASDCMLGILKHSYMTDQPLLNIYAGGDFTQIPREWNVSANHLNKYDQYKLYGIIHWHGRKPFEPGQNRPLQHFYNKYRLR